METSPILSHPNSDAWPAMDSVSLYGHLFDPVQEALEHRQNMRHRAERIIFISVLANCDAGMMPAHGAVDSSIANVSEQVFSASFMRRKFEVSIPSH